MVLVRAYVLRVFYGRIPEERILNRERKLSLDSRRNALGEPQDKPIKKPAQLQSPLALQPDQ
jgi:hypothetical protein